MIILHRVHSQRRPDAGGTLKAHILNSAPLQLYQHLRLVRLQLVLDEWAHKMPLSHFPCCQISQQSERNGFSLWRDWDEDDSGGGGGGGGAGGGDGDINHPPSPPRARVQLCDTWLTSHHKAGPLFWKLHKIITLYNFGFVWRRKCLKLRPLTGTIICKIKEFDTNAKQIPHFYTVCLCICVHVYCN